MGLTDSRPESRRGETEVSAMEVGFRALAKAANSRIMLRSRSSDGTALRDSCRDAAMSECLVGDCLHPAICAHASTLTPPGRAGAGGGALCVCVWGGDGRGEGEGKSPARSTRRYVRRWTAPGDAH